MNSTASQSSSSGWLGYSDCIPKSSLLFTIPVPKYVSQNRLTATRAVSGWFGATSHFASASRSGLIPLGQWRQRRRHAGGHFLARLIVLPTF
jgi:hypothetical protein